MTKNNSHEDSGDVLVRPYKMTLVEHAAFIAGVICRFIWELFKAIAIVWFLICVWIWYDKDITIECSYVDYELLPDQFVCLIGGPLLPEIMALEMTS